MTRPIKTGGWLLFVAATMALVGCGHKADSNAVQTQQSIQENAARQAAAVRNMPQPASAQNPYAAHAASQSAAARNMPMPGAR